MIWYSKRLRLRTCSLAEWRLSSLRLGSLLAFRSEIDVKRILLPPSQPPRERRENGKPRWRQVGHREMAVN